MIAETFSKISTSPRDELKGVEDSQLLKETRQYVHNSRPLSLLVLNLRSAIIENKPVNIIDYIVDVFFRTENLQDLREIISK